MSYRRDRRFEQRDHDRRVSCQGCKDIGSCGISWRKHSCGQTILTARQAGLSGQDIDRIAP